MARSRFIARSALFNWASYGVTFVVAFFLSPYVVHHLGNIPYGVWTLVGSLVSYMGLLDLGLRGAVTRYVARFRTQGEHSEASRSVSAALWLRMWISVFIVLASATLAFLLPRFVNLPPDLQSAMRWALFLTGTNLAMTLTFGVFGAVLAAMHRFDMLSSVTMSQALARAIGVVLLLRAGHGIVSLAALELSIGVAANLSIAILAFRVYPQLRISLSRPATEILKTLWSYSFYAFLINVAVQVVYYTDNLIVGAFVSLSAVTLYAIGGTLIEYLRQLVSSLTVAFTPLASSLEAEGEKNEMKRLLIHGTRASLLIALPIEVALFFRGPTFIELWMGPQYAATSGKILQILLVAQIFALANNTSGGIAYGMGKHKPVAIWACVEGVSNLVLSIILVRRWGIIGIAWGTAIASLAIHLTFWPRYICKLVQMPVAKYLWRAWAQPFIAVAPFAAACYLADKYWKDSSLLIFFGQIAALLPLFVAGIAVCFWGEIREFWRGPLNPWRRKPAAQ